MSLARVIRIFFCVVFSVALFFSGCEKQHETFFQGYVEGDFVHIASPLAGQLAELHVERGTQVKSGGPCVSGPAPPTKSLRAARIRS